MLRVAHYLRFHSTADVTAILREAYEAAAAAELPCDLIVPAFSQAVALVAAGHRELEQTVLNGPTMHVPRG